MKELRSTRLDDLPKIQLTDETNTKTQNAVILPLECENRIEKVIVMKPQDKKRRNEQYSITKYLLGRIHK